MKKNQLCHLFLILLFLTTLLSCSQKKLAVKQLLIIITSYIQTSTQVDTKIVYSIALSLLVEIGDS